jgi:chorismate binding enzyme
VILLLEVILVPDSLRFDAFRSIFPAGTVSGAPKIKAIELVYGLEEDHRGVYAGAVGRFDFANDEMDTCIAIRTTVFKDGVAYLQAGGGIVHDSIEEDEYYETINKLKGNMKALEEGERKCTWFPNRCWSSLNDLRQATGMTCNMQVIRRPERRKNHVGFSQRPNLVYIECTVFCY